MKRNSFRNMPLAITGMACRLPGADNLEQYWQLLHDGGSAVTELPPQRLDPELYYHPKKGVRGKSYTKLSGIVRDRPFDRDLCPISDELLASAETSHLSMLEVAAAACRHARLDPFALPLRNTGVFIGHATGGPLASDAIYSTRIEEMVQYLKDLDLFMQLSPDQRDLIVHDMIEHGHLKKPRSATGGKLELALNAAAGLISAAFGLNGPYMAVNAACASSMYALVLAAQALHHERIDMAIVGGASYSGYYNLLIFSQAQALSATGSFPFDARADGFISSDGYAAVLLKTLPRALSDGDTIYGVIRGIGISCDGRGKSLWAPRQEGQVEAIRRAYALGLDPARLQYIEAHGTSTQLGDSIEVSSLAAALRDLLPPGTKIPIASVKANIGHTVEAAGIASLIKTLLSMQHGIVPPAINYETPNPEIDWEQVPFFVPTSKTEWPVHKDGHPRRAAINSFGIGGLNAHIVVDQAATEMHTALFVPGKASAYQDGIVKSENDDDAVAIIGLGAIFPGAYTVAAYWDLLTSGRDPKSTISTDNWNLSIFRRPGSNSSQPSPILLGGFTSDFAYDWKKHKIPPKQLGVADPLQFMLLDAADQALRDAGYESKSFNRRRVGVVVGTIFASTSLSDLILALRLPEFERKLAVVLCEQGVPEEQTREILETYCKAFLRYKPMMRDETGSYSSSTLASRIAKSLDLMGGAFALDAGEASSLAAVSTSVDLLLSGTCDMMLCAGAQRAMDINMYELLMERGLLCLGYPKAAFDGDANGIVPGEGVGMLLLKRLSDARRDGDPIRAIIRGVAAATDTTSPNKAITTAIERALAMSGIRAPDVTMVEAVGISTASIDTQEVRALMATYGSEPRESPLLLGSVAGQIGHTLGASGMASLLKMILAFENRQLPASVGLSRPIASLAEHATALRIASENVPIPATIQGNSWLGGVSSFAIRGSAYHALIECNSNVPVTIVDAVGPADWRIIRMGAATMDELIKKVIQSEDNAASLYATADMTPYFAHDRVRLAIVADNKDTLAQKLRRASEQMAHQGMHSILEEQGIFCREATQDQPRVAFLFPGQGSQYTGMLRELIRDVPAAAAMLREIDVTMSRLGYPTFSEIAWKTDSGLGSDVWRTQVSLLLADTIMYAALESVGIRPDVISDHSYGEYPALLAVGAWTLAQAIRVTSARCELIEASEKARGVMLATNASPAVVKKLSAKIQGTVCLANHNAPDQTVVGGNREAIAEIDSRLAAEGFENRLLSVPRPFHTSLMADVREPLQRVLEEQLILPPKTPLLSSVTNRYVADPLDIRKNLVNQLTEPVLYVDLIERLARDGISVLVEVGPRQVLTRLNRRILVDRNATIISCDNPKRPGLEQIIHVRAALECAGVLISNTKTVEQRQSKSGSLAADKPKANGQIIHFDATVHRKQSMLKVADSRRSMPAQPPPITGQKARDELETFLINFVCEQTGYPAEVVGLDVDLEADLGIDSIKKAQLFGELQEHFDIQVQAANSLSLDNYPTLGHVLDFLRKSSIDLDKLMSKKSALNGSEPTRADGAASASTTNQGVLDTTSSLDGLNFIKCAGTPYEMGVQHARSQEEQIKNLLRVYEHLLISSTKVKGKRSLQALWDGVEQSNSYFSPSGLEELRGMADALGLPIEHIIAYNLGIIAYNLGLSPEYSPGCTQFAIAARRNGPVGMLHGVNEDWPGTLSLSGGITRIVQVRHPRNGIPHVTFSISGQLGGLNGINASGVAVTSTLLLDRQQPNTSTVGTIHSMIVMAILEHAEDIETAVDIVRSFERAGAWSLCISHYPTDRICYLEYDGPSLLVQLDQDVVTTTNHCHLHPPLVPVTEHSRHRLTRLQSLLEIDGPTGFILEQAQAVLRDRYDLGRQRETAHPTMNTIRRVDNQISIVMQPAAGEIWTTPGPLAKEKENHYYRLNVRELFALGTPPAPPTDAYRSNIVTSESVAGTDSDEVQADEEGHTMSRFVLRTINAPLDNIDRTPHFHGPVVILGANPTSRAMRERFEELGATVLELPVSDDHQEVLATVDRFWAMHPIPHLFLATARDKDAACGFDEDSWVRRREVLLLVYLVCQHWVRLVSQAHLLDKATLVAITSLGGDFGFSGHVTAVEGGGLAGLLKSIRREFEGMLVKVIDTLPEESPERVVDAICTELAIGSPEVEVGYVRNQRCLVKAVPRLATPLEHKAIPSGGTWVVTGGARGITSLVARELGRRFGLVLHLIGTSSMPQIEEAWRNLSATELKELKVATTQKARQAGLEPSIAWHKVEKAIEIDKVLRAFAEDGVQATYHSCDVSDREALAKVLDRIRQSDGSIQGIIHGAGVEAAARFDRKKLENVRATIAAKIDGAAALMALTREDPLAYFVVFGSVSGRFGGLGQTDYALASDMLCKMIQQFRAERPMCASVAFHWPPWSALGMAMRFESKLAIEMSKQRFMSPLEGIAHLINELNSGAPEGEVLILDRPGILDLDGIMPTSMQRRTYPRRRDVIADSPLIEGVYELNENHSLVAEVRFDPTSDLFLLEHQFQSMPLLPAVIGIESLAEAASILACDQTVVGLRNVEIVNGFRFYSSQLQRAHVRARLTEQGIECELSGDFYNRHGQLIDPHRVYAKGILDMAERPMPITLSQVDEQPHEWYDMEYPDAQWAKQAGLVWHGPSLRSLRQICLQSEEGWGRIVVPPLAELGGKRSGRWIIAAAVLDASLVACGVFAHRELLVNQLPQFFEHLFLGRLPHVGETCTVHLNFRGRQDQSINFDFVVFGDDGAVILSAKGYRCVILSKR